MKTYTLLLLLFIPIFSFCQTTDEKIEFLIKSFKIDDMISLYYSSSGKKDIKKEINKNLINYYKDTYTKSEIDEIFAFFHSSTGKKFIDESINIQRLMRYFPDLKNNFSQDSVIVNPDFNKIDDELSIHSDSAKSFENNEKIDFSSIRNRKIERADGFYKILKNSTKENIILSETPDFPLNKIESTSYKLNEINKYYTISITLFEKEKFRIFTEKNISQSLALVINKTIICVPTLNSSIPFGEFVISGNFSEKEAKEIVTNLHKNQ